MSIDVTDVLKENGILVTRWGRAREYVDFWKVLRVEGSEVSLIRVKNNRRPDKKGEEFAFLPIMDATLGDKITRPATLVNGVLRLKIDEGQYARVWDGQAVKVKHLAGAG